MGAAFIKVLTSKRKIKWDSKREEPYLKKCKIKRVEQAGVLTMFVAA